MKQSQTESPFNIAWRKGKQAAWENRYIGLCLWVFGCAVVVGYYRVEFIRNGFEALGEFKIQTGWMFGIVSTAFFGGLLPVVLPLLFGQPKQAGFASLLVSNVLFWGYKGFEVDLLYRVQAWLFGNEADFQTIACKVIVDMVFYAPLIGLLDCVLFYIWRDHGYSLSATRKSLGENWYIRKILPALISNCCVWLPAIVFIYSLPLALQLPVQNLILCFWVLVLVFFTNQDDEQRSA